MAGLEQAREAFYAELGPKHLAPLWSVLKSLVTPTPTTPIVAAAWRYDEVRPELMRAGELITAEEAERRVLILENPALPGAACITRTLYAGLQLILPGEIAPCHRHTQSALRFVLEGDGAHTAVDGERAIMRPFDLILTPNGRWHDHGNDSQAPMVWLDGLDIPLVTAFDASFSEHLEGRAQHPAGAEAGTSAAIYGRGLRAAASAPSPLFHYPYVEWRKALQKAAAAQAPDPHEGVKLEFVDPSTGGPVMRTMSAFCHLLPAGFVSRPLRRTDATVFVGVEGEAMLEVDGKSFMLGPRDIAVVPAWAPQTLRAVREAMLFAYSDRAAQQALGLWREARE